VVAAGSNGRGVADPMELIRQIAVSSPPALMMFTTDFLKACGRLNPSI
jgi:hypothetical protein